MLAIKTLPLAVLVLALCLDDDDIATLHAALAEAADSAADAITDVIDGLVDGVTGGTDGVRDRITGDASVKVQPTAPTAPTAPAPRLPLSLRISQLPGADHLVTVAQQHPQLAKAVVGGVVAGVVALAIALTSTAGPAPGSPQASGPSASPTAGPEPSALPPPPSAAPTDPASTPGGDPGTTPPDQPGAPSTSLPPPAPPPPPGEGVTVKVDATRLASTHIAVVGATAPLDRRQVHDVVLRRSTRYAIYAAGAKPVPFSVSADGLVEYESTATSLSGQGTTTLLVRGLPITVNATSLSYSHIGVSGTGWVENKQPRQLFLLPGGYTLVATYATPIPFTVSVTGTIDYPTTPFASGRGTSTLTLTGLPISVDATGLSYVDIGISGTGWATNKQVRRLSMLPGAYTFVAAYATPIPFTVSATGTIDYPTTPFASGRGTATLTVTGRPIMVDGTAMSFLYVGVSAFGWMPNNRVQQLSVLPGRYSVVSVGGTPIPFTVSTAGTVTYTAASYLAGNGTSTLTITGVPIAIDATALPTALMVLANATNWINSRQPANLRVLPGQYHFQVTDHSADFRFTVNATHTVDYDPSLTHVSGRGTNTMTVRPPN